MPTDAMAFVSAVEILGQMSGSETERISTVLTRVWFMATGF